MSAAQTGVPDLLRRFAAAPHCASVVVDGCSILLHTDDIELIATAQRKSTNAARVPEREPLLAKVIRDDDAPQDGEDIIVMTAWPLATLLLGRGTSLTLDCERREILGFLAPNVTAEQVVTQLLPKLLKQVPRRGLAETGHAVGS